MADPYRTAVAPDTEPDWRQRAACANPDVDPEIFFAHPGGSATLALEICRTCPVREQCLAHALTQPETDGIWGGKTPNQRQDIRRRIGLKSVRRISPLHGCGTEAGFRRHLRNETRPCEPCREASLDARAERRHRHSAAQTQRTATKPTRRIPEVGQNGTDATRGQNGVVR